MAEETRQYVPIYYESPEHAYSDGYYSDDAEAFRTSNEATTRCARAIRDAVNENYDGAALDTSFTEELIEEHGLERVEYVLASVIQSHAYDTNFSEDNKSWAESIRISDSRQVTQAITLGVRADIINTLTDAVKDKARAAETEDAVGEDETPTEAEVTPVQTEESEEETAPVQTNEYTAPVEEAETDVTDETIYEMDSDTAEPTEPSNETEETVVAAAGESSDEEEGKTAEYTVTVPRAAMLKRYENAAVFTMPRGHGHDLYKFMVKGEDYDLRKPDGSIDVTLRGDREGLIRLAYRGDERHISAKELSEILSSAEKGEFQPRFFSVRISKDAVYANFEKAVKVKFPEGSAYKKSFTVIPKSFEDVAASNDNTTVYSIPDYADFTVKTDAGDIRLSAEEMACEMAKGDWKPRTTWLKYALPKEAIIRKYEKHTLFKMPDGGYAGYVYYIPNGMVKGDDEKGEVTLNLPGDRKTILKCTGKEDVELSSLQLRNLMYGKTVKDYVGAEEKAAAEAAEKRMSLIKENLPAEMIETPNWTAVRVKDKGKGERLDKYFLEPSEGVTGTDFDSAVELAKKEGGNALGYFFDGNSHVACLELDGCLDGNGNPKTDVARKILETCDDAYVEKSVSGKGLHIFGKMAEEGIAHVSKDGSIELFTGCGAVVVTGDVLKSPKSLGSFTEGSLKDFMAENFEADKPAEPLTEGDRETLERLMASETGGDKFTRLYEGEDVCGTTDRSDVSLAMRISCAAMGDGAAVKRIYGSSKRADKSPEHIDHITIRAVKNTESFVRRARENAERRENAPEKTTDKAAGKNDGYGDEKIPF